MTQDNQKTQEQISQPPVPKPTVNVVRGTGLLPTDFDSLWRVSTVFARSGLMPKGMAQPETVFVALEMGLEVGLPPMQAVQNIAVINGRPSIWGDALLGLVQGSGLLEDFQEFYEGKEGTDEFRAVCIAKRKGRSAPIRNEFSVGDAKKAGLWGKEGPWRTYPKRMLKMRARAWTLRDGFADVLKGMRMAEEALDMDQVLDVAPLPETPPEPEPEAVGALPAVEEPTPEDLMAALQSTAPAGTALLRLEEFVRLTAEAQGMEPEKLLQVALEKTAEFWPAYQRWLGGQKKAKGKPSKAKKQAEPETQEAKDGALPLSKGGAA